MENDQETYNRNVILQRDLKPTRSTYTAEKVNMIHEAAPDQISF